MNKPVLLLTFNRLDYLKDVFEKVKEAKPPRLYQEVRNYMLSNIDWDCEVKTRFLKTNSGGCCNGVSGAITWFFENEKDGIILEDDIVPDISFFNFCEELLDKYNDNKEIWTITGYAPVKTDLESSYYFAKIPHCWGWATWADRWEHFKLDMSGYDRENLKYFSERKEVQKYWEDILIGLQEQRIDSWAYPWTFWIVANNGYCINPVKNLISNIGVTGLHYTNSKNLDLNKCTNEFETLIHPKDILFNDKLIDLIYKDKFGIFPKNVVWYKKIFSIVNDNNQKILTILGVKIKFRRKEN